MRDDHEVYIIAPAADGWTMGPVKVGISNNSGARLSSIQTGYPHELTIVAKFVVPNRSIALYLERAFQDVMKEERLKGEWFNMDAVRAVSLMCVNIRAALQAHTSFSPDEIERLLTLSGVTAHEEVIGAMREMAKGGQVQ